MLYNIMFLPFTVTLSVQFLQKNTQTSFILDKIEQDHLSTLT